MNLKKVSLRIEPEVLRKIDSLVDYIRIRNRSDAIRHLVRNAMGAERIAVILAKGDDKDIDICKHLKFKNGDFAILEKIGDRTLAEMQYEMLMRAGFSKVFYIVPDDMLIGLQKLIPGKNSVFIANNDRLSMDALRLLPVHSDFLVFYTHDLPVINLAGLFEEHIQKNNYVTLNLTWGHEGAKNFIEVDGTKIIGMEERSTMKSHLTYNAAFVANSRFLKEKGGSVVYDVFPRLAGEGRMNGFISANRVLRYKRASDKEEILKAWLEYKKQN